MRRRRTLFWMMSLGIGVGCGSNGGLPSKTVSQTVGAAGAAIEITSASDPAIAGTMLLIPAGALTADTTITVSLGGELAQPAAHEVAVGPSVRFTPDGLVFAKAVTLTLPYVAASAPSGDALAIDFNGSAGRGRIAGALSVDSAAGTVSGDILHFTDYEVVAAPGTTGACQTDSDCASGTACVSGACVSVASDGGTDGGPHDGGFSDSGFSDGGPTDGGASTDAGPVDLAHAQG